MTRWRFAFGLLFVLLFAAGARAQTPPRAEHVFIISIDGGKPAVMRECVMPTLNKLVREGAVTWGAQTILPSITLVSHTAMLTGLEPLRHQVLWNDWIPERGMVPVPTIFALAKKATGRKISTAMFVSKPKFIHLLVPGTVDEFSLPAYEALTVAELAGRYIERKKPNLCFIHFADPDGAGHSFGWGSEEQRRAFERVDLALQRIWEAIIAAGIKDRSVVIVTADHGGHAKTHGTDSPEDRTIPWVAWGAGVRPGQTITAPVSTCDTAATALWLLGVPRPERLDGKPVVTAFVP